MESWRYVRPLLAGRFLELPQEHLVAAPEASARRLMTFLGAPDAVGPVAEMFRSRRENTAYPELSATDAGPAPDWTRERQAVLRRICGPEANRWGYELDFENPSRPDLERQILAAGPAPSMQEYCHWASQEVNERARLLEDELQVLRGLLDRVAAGKVMRIMNLVGALGRSVTGRS
jgi:hypothetical protein